MTRGRLMLLKENEHVDAMRGMFSRRIVRRAADAR
jgi:hypothetical protein